MINLTAVTFEDNGESAMGEHFAGQECIGKGRNILDRVNEMGEWFPMYKAF